MNKDLKLVLASSSPRRIKYIKEDDKLKSIFSNLDDCLIIVKPTLDEHLFEKNILNILTNDEIMNYPLMMSLMKLENVLSTNHNLVNKDDYLILTVDTSVIMNNKIYDKPKDIEDNIKILMELSNKTHLVISGYSIYYQNKIYTNKSISYVTFNDLSSSFINSYAFSSIGLDKAGGYSYQDDKNGLLIKETKGSKFNIYGIPLEDIYNDLVKIIR